MEYTTFNTTSYTERIPSDIKETVTNINLLVRQDFINTHNESKDTETKNTQKKKYTQKSKYTRTLFSTPFREYVAVNGPKTMSLKDCVNYVAKCLNATVYNSDSKITGTISVYINGNKLCTVDELNRPLYTQNFNFKTYFRIEMKNKPNKYIGIYNHMMKMMKPNHVITVHEMNPHINTYLSFNAAPSLLPKSTKDTGTESLEDTATESLEDTATESLEDTATESLEDTITIESLNFNFMLLENR